MKGSAILKSTGIIVASFTVITVLIFFLYPYLNKVEYEKIVSENRSDEINPGLQEGQIGGEFEYLSKQISYFRREQSRLLGVIDSLEEVNAEIKLEFEKLLADFEEERANMELIAEQEPASEPESVEEGPLLAEMNMESATSIEVDGEEFFDKVKSFLNLDEEELAPIASKLSNDELVRLYKGGGTIQREKLLRSLKPERAAEIMKEIML